MKSIIHEDNAACLDIANDTNELMGSCTRHLSIKWHHFQDQVCSGAMTAIKVTSHLNWANIFMKPLYTKKFWALCKLLMGW